MTTLNRSLTVPAPLELVADYLCDLTTSPQWDRFTVRCQRVDEGPITVGSRYEHTRAYGGFEVTIEMAVVIFEPMARVAWQGGSDYGTGREELSFAVDGTGDTVVNHTVDVTLHGIARFGAAMLPTVMARIADEGTPAMRTALLELADHRDGR